MAVRKDQHKVGTPLKPRGQQTGFAGNPDQNRKEMEKTPALRARLKNCAVDPHDCGTWELHCRTAPIFLHFLRALTPPVPDPRGGGSTPSNTGMETRSCLETTPPAIRLGLMRPIG